MGLENMNKRELASLDLGVAIKGGHKKRLI
jgi:hypothetical protein